MWDRKYMFDDIWFKLERSKHAQKRSTRRNISLNIKRVSIIHSFNVKKNLHFTFPLKICTMRDWFRVWNRYGLLCNILVFINEDSHKVDGPIIKKISGPTTKTPSEWLREAAKQKCSPLNGWDIKA